MNKSFKYTILTLFLALVFAFGSMAGMNLILEAREKQILTESGKAVIEAPVRAWQEQESGETGETGEESDSTAYTLTTGQMEEVIKCWNHRTGVTVHDPVTGQISMEEAIKAGEEWLVEMGIDENKQQDKEIFSISATLGIAEQEASMGIQSEPYYSFWTVQFSDISMNVVLYINAVTGKVWGAEITLYENFPEGMSYEKFKRFVELSGLQTNADIISNQEETQAILEIDDSHIFAEAEFYYSQIYNGNETTDYNEELHYANVRINYALTVNSYF